MKIRVFLFSAFLFSSPAFAGGVDALKAFIGDTRTAKASFSQTVLDQNGKLRQKSEGTLAFSRPGKFRWVYHKPYEQLIVGRRDVADGHGRTRQAGHGRPDVGRGFSPAGHGSRRDVADGHGRTRRRTRQAGPGRPDGGRGFSPAGHGSRTRQTLRAALRQAGHGRRTRQT